MERAADLLRYRWWLICIPAITGMKQNRRIYMKIIGITGAGVGSGKSEVLRYLRREIWRSCV